jgi:hypothetical protein
MKIYGQNSLMDLIMRILDGYVLGKKKILFIMQKKILGNYLLMLIEKEVKKDLKEEVEGD